MSQRYESERDALLVFVGFGAVVVTAVCLLPLFSANVNSVIKVGTAGVLVLTVTLVVWVYLRTYYVVGAGVLEVRSGPFRWRIQIEQIHRVSPTRSPLSSPALSLNRLRIDYGKGKSILLSPERREDFIRDLGGPVT